LSDTGIGIPADRIESIFDPFVQINTRLTRTEKGVGSTFTLTLSTCPITDVFFDLVTPRGV
jgi:signal transduction histidine kinase